MTSEPRQCFVYVWLPGKTTAVTAGRYETATDRNGQALGRFVYGKSYLANPNAVELDPVELKLIAKRFTTTAMKGVFGALRDASPDHWGRVLIERSLRRSGLDEIDYLLESPDDRAGALGFGLGVKPPPPKRQFNRTLDLERLQATADELVLDGSPEGPDAEQVERLLCLVTSMGGARPKAVVEDEDGLWLAKFNKPTDPWNYARVEHAMLELARTCGITVADSRVVRVGGRDTLLVKRFDRQRAKGGYRRARMVSAITLLGTDDDVLSRGRWSYVLLAEELRRCTSDPRWNVHEMFRRMVFNGLISNIDDHPRNHAALAWEGSSWRLSPAYDLTPATPVSDTQRDLAMACGDMGRWANAANMLSQSRRFMLEPAEAAATIDDMERTVVASWLDALRRSGVTAADAERLRRAFAYPGFRGT